MSNGEQFHAWCQEHMGGRNVVFLRDEEGRVYGVRKRVPAFLLPVFQALRQVESPHLPTILSLVQEGDTLAITETYIPGLTLRQILDEKGHAADADVLALARDMCSALSVTHGLNPPVIHRDIKPENVIQTQEGRYVLIDFDAARQYMENAAGDTVLLGTHGYAAPEQYGFFAKRRPQRYLFPWRYPV